jgi:hypothetical protein
LVQVIVRWRLQRIIAHEPLHAGGALVLLSCTAERLPSDDPPLAPCHMPHACARRLTLVGVSSVALVRLYVPERVVRLLVAGLAALPDVDALICGQPRRSSPARGVPRTVGEGEGVGVAISPCLLEQSIIACPDLHVDVVRRVGSCVEAVILAVHLDRAGGAFGREVEELVLCVGAVVGEAVCPDVSELSPGMIRLDWMSMLG